MSNVDPAVTAAEAEVQKAEADLANAEKEATETVCLATLTPWSEYHAANGLVITFGGINVPATLADELLAAVPGALRKVDSAQ